MATTVDGALPADAVIERTVQALKTRTNIETVVARDRAEALELLIARVPDGVELFPSTSMTLEAIGFLDHLAKNPDRYRNLRDMTAKEADPDKRAQLRRRTAIADYFIGSVHAVTQAGEVVIASRTGSQLAPYVYGASKVIWVVGAQKIVPTLEAALQRVREHALPLESQRIRRAGSNEDSLIGKVLIVNHERQAGRISAIMVKEPLGF